MTTVFISVVLIFQLYSTMDTQITDAEKEIKKLKSILHSNQQELLSLENKISQAKVLQLKARSILENSKKKMENESSELEEIEQNFKKFACSKHKFKNPEDPRRVEELEKELSELQKKQQESKMIKKNLAAKLYKLKMELAERKVNSEILRGG